MTKEQKLRGKIRHLIREIMSEDGVDSATIKYKKPEDPSSATIDKPKKHKASSATIKEKRGYTQKELLKLLKKSRDGFIEVHVHGKDLSVDDESMLDTASAGFGLTDSAKEIEFKYRDVEFVNIDGKRV